MAVTERIRDTIAPAMAEMSVELVDIEHIGATLRITIDCPGGVDLEVISRATRRISHLLDDVDPLADRYTLEVSSPGLERPLRQPEHFAKAIGSKISIKTLPNVDGDRRVTGLLVAAGDEAIEVEDPMGDTRRLRYNEIDKARTVFDWGPSPKPGSNRAPKPTTKKKATSQ